MSRVLSIYFVHTIKPIDAVKSMSGAQLKLILSILSKFIPKLKELGLDKKVNPPCFLQRAKEGAEFGLASIRKVQDVL